MLPVRLGLRLGEILETFGRATKFYICNFNCKIAALDESGAFVWRTRQVSKPLQKVYRKPKDRSEVGYTLTQGSSRCDVQAANWVSETPVLEF